MAHPGLLWGANVSSMRRPATMPRVSYRHLNLRPTGLHRSWSRSLRALSVNPSIIAYPKTENDVALAIKYATSKDPEARKTSAWPSGYPLKVMGRGGGHQYCGTSCDNDALILDMQHFNTIETKNVTLEGVTGPDLSLIHI